ncbi:MAG TPA: hypothetical protein VKA95_05450 [Nitrososphaeraceae archaeon]|nr:hypothetical protein [Nitrososphaeraceae archaeon]
MNPAIILIFVPIIVGIIIPVNVHVYAIAPISDIDIKSMLDKTRFKNMNTTELELELRLIQESNPNWECMDRNENDVCDNIFLRNGTGVLLERVPKESDLKEEDYVIVGGEKKPVVEWDDDPDVSWDDADSKDDDKKEGNDCWDGREFVGKDECDTHGLPLCSETEGVACFDDRDYPDEDSDEDDDEDETKNCGGEPCTATEKEDSWLD